VEGFRGIVNNITTNNYLTFTDEEIPVEGRGHNKALHVSVKCLDHIVAKVLIDNGSSLNVMPKDTFYAILPPRELDRRLQEDWARNAREGPRVLMSLRVDFGPMG